VGPSLPLPEVAARSRPTGVAVARNRRPAAVAVAACNRPKVEAALVTTEAGRRVLRPGQAAVARPTSPVLLSFLNLRAAQLVASNDPGLHRERIDLREHHADQTNDQPELADDAGGDQHKAADERVDRHPQRTPHNPIDAQARANPTLVESQH